MKKYAFVILMAIFVLVSCSQDFNPADEINISTTFAADLKGGQNITVSATYKTAYFSSDSSKFNKDLAMLSYVGATSAKTKQANLSFFNNLYFSDAIALGWDTEPTADSVAFTIAHRSTSDSVIIAITVRGFNYQSEWANNLTIGKTGDHQGFDIESDKILAALYLYLDLYISNPKNLKVWITGYSRGGAISDMLSHKILADKLVKEENLYTYTFEAPSSLVNEYKHSCIHNIRNYGDLIPYVPPKAWGFYTAGVETNIYSDNIRTYLIEDLGISEDAFPEFDPDISPNPSQYISNLLGSFMNIDYFSTREKYYSNVQTPLSNFIAMLMADKEKGLGVLMNYFSEMTMDEILSFAKSCMSDEMYAYNTFKSLFTDSKVAFDDNQLKDVSTLITNLLNDGNTITLFAAIFFTINNAKYVVLSHYPEVTYIALKHYQAN